MVQDQLDLRIGAANLLKFQKNFRDRRTVKFPEPLTSVHYKNVLIEEYKRGLPITIFLDHGAGVFDTMIASMGKILYKSYLLFIFFYSIEIEIIEKFSHRL